MRRTGTKTASVNNLTVDTAGLQSLLSAGYPTAVEIGTAAGARITVGRNTMANKRMFSIDVVDTDKFLDMPVSTQALYFHFGMRADDDQLFLKNERQAERQETGY